MQEEKEEWRDIFNYEGLYQVSNLGRVRSLDRIIYRSNGVIVNKRGRILILRDNGSGYLYVDLHKSRKHQRIYVHKLVAQAFCPNPNGYIEVNHKDECKNNNIANNLEWCNHSYNSSYGTKTQRTVATCKRNGVYEKAIDLKTELGIYGGRKKVAMCDSNDNVIKVFNSLSEASKIINVNAGKICECCKGSRRFTRGYKWKYYEQDTSI